MRRTGYLLAFAGLASAGAVFEVYALTHQRLQMIVDVSAQRGARAKAVGGDVEQAVRGWLAQHSMPGRGGTVEVESPPPDGRFRNMPRVVRVSVRTRWNSSVIPFDDLVAIPLELESAATTLAPEPGEALLPTFRVE